MKTTVFRPSQPNEYVLVDGHHSTLLVCSPAGHPGGAQAPPRPQQIWAEKPLALSRGWSVEPQPWEAEAVRSAATQTAVREEETDRGSDGRESAARAQGNAGGATLPAHSMRGADRPRAGGAELQAAPRAPVLEAAAVRSAATQTAVRE